MKEAKVSWSNLPVEIVGLPRQFWDTETGFQIYAATWLRKYYPEIRFHHSANERQGAKAGFYCKLKGQSKGFPDFLIWRPDRQPLAIELKVKDGKVSHEQDTWLAFLTRQGWASHVCYTMQEFAKLVS